MYHLSKIQHLSMLVVVVVALQILRPILCLEPGWKSKGEESLFLPPTTCERPVHFLY